MTCKKNRLWCWGVRDRVDLESLALTAARSNPARDDSFFMWGNYPASLRKVGSSNQGPDRVCTWGHPSPIKLKSRHIIFTVLVRRKTQPKGLCGWSIPISPTFNYQLIPLIAISYLIILVFSRPNFILLHYPIKVFKWKNVINFTCLY